MSPPLILGVNLDHVATLRQARYAKLPDHFMAEPRLENAVTAAIEGGAESITLHLREDRRHIQDGDVRMTRRLSVPLNLEMGVHPEIVEIAAELAPASVCLVPEKREEVTTEGGLDAAGALENLTTVTKRLQAGGTRVSLFLDPDPVQMEAAAKIGADMVELHTGSFALKTGAPRAEEIARLIHSAEVAHQLGLQVNAGHGLTNENLPDLFAVPHLTELNIGHHIISRALFIGLRAAVAEIRAVMDRYPVRE